MSQDSLTRDHRKRAAALAEHGCVHRAVDAGALPQYADLTLTEALVLALGL